MTELRDVVVVGGGVAGLTAGYRLMGLGLDVTVVERDSEPGGKATGPVPVGDLRLEPGPDSFVARKPWAVDLCRELDVELEPPGAAGAYLWTDGGLVKFLKDSAFGIPGDVGDVLRWPGLSRAGRRRAARDLVRRAKKDDHEETLGQLLRRRLGDEATDLVVGPLLAGLFAGEVDRLSAPATFPELIAWEQAQGSLVRGSQAARRMAGRSDAGPMFLRPRGGVHELPRALAAALGNRLRTKARAVAVVRDGDRYAVKLEDAEAVRVGAVVVATEARAASVLLRDLAPEPAGELGAIRYVSTGVVFLVYPEGTQGGLPEGTGFVVPRGMAPFTACTWVSSKWPDPAYGTRAVLRCYVGADGDEDVLDASDGDIVEACARHVGAVLDLPEPDRPPQPLVHRWCDAMPQYEIGHQGRVRRIRDGLPPGIFVVGNAYDGVGIAETIHGADDAARAVAALAE